MEDLPDAGLQTTESNEPDLGTTTKKPEENDDGVYIRCFLCDILMYPVHILQLDYDSNFNFPSKPRMTNGEEPQVIAEWRRNQAERIRAKDEEEEMRKKEMRERAKKDLED